MATASDSADDAVDPVMSKHTLRIMLSIVLVTIIILTVLGNLLVIVALCKDRQLRKKKTNFFVVSLAFVDLLVALVVMPLAAIELTTGQWSYGDTFCLVRTSLDVQLTTVSILHLCCIALDRYYAICCQPLVYNNKMTPIRVSLMLVGCWVISFFISFLPIMQSWNTIGIESFIEQRKLNSSRNSTCVFMVNRPYALVCSAVAFYVPLMLMGLAYQRIYITAIGHARRIGSLHRAGSAPSSTYHNHEQSGSSRIKNETKAAKTLAVIMGCFCLCWAPFFITNVVDPFINYSVPWQMWTAWLWLGYINSGLNPFLYAFLNRAFRRAFIRILCCGDKRYARQGGFSPSRQHSESVKGTSISLRLSFLQSRRYSNNSNRFLSSELESQESVGAS
ncbi:5-hydroxytryptamine receptor 4 isoform X1 [Pimephales promelas]|uniref:5-hydroxytryptamine receptor 4 isoform X1 n=1 Tax=Pimephales promelas TaxID=90988 RepID=UPI001955BF47|nr:5-hydroxytryptamine receptor 4 isoform X1 [Pimephales promelas]XP_039544264.1 5-hydroxytryptamine receptor 4 isoform X1 [Pimephales promelas]KAG1943481.1 5-hydroxytryptamine receptor [Pimephales promelas]KAG1943482.1 5-hydroxytryptamine receptor [Pimephales promelas]